MSQLQDQDNSNYSDIPPVKKLKTDDESLSQLSQYSTISKLLNNVPIQTAYELYCGNVAAISPNNTRDNTLPYSSELDISQSHGQVRQLFEEFEELDMEEIDNLLINENININEERLLMNFPFADKMRLESKDIIDLFYVHCKSQACCMVMRLLLLPMVTFYNINLNLMTWICLLNPNINNLLLESSLEKLYNFAVWSTSIPWSFRFKIRIDYRPDLARFAKISEDEFLRKHLLSNTIYNIEDNIVKGSIRLALKCLIGNDNLFNLYEAFATKFKSFKISSSATSSEITDTYLKMDLIFVTIEPINHVIKVPERLTKKSRIARDYCLDCQEDGHETPIIINDDVFNCYILECLIFEVLNTNGCQCNENFFDITFKIDMSVSSNPHYAFSSLIFDNLDVKDVKRYTYRYHGPEVFISNDLSTEQFTSDLFKRLMSHRSIFKEHRSSLVKSVNNRNFNGKSIVAVQEEVLDKSFKPCEDLSKWKKKPKALEKLKPKDQFKKLKSNLLLEIAKKNVTPTECSQYIVQNLIERDDEVGDYLRNKFPLLHHTMVNLKQTITDVSQDLCPPRRYTLARFLKDGFYGNQDVYVDIKKIRAHPLYPDMCIAMKEYIKTTLGREFIYLSLLHLFKHDNSTNLTKAPGFLILGSSNSGKSVLLSVMMNLFEKLNFTNSRYQNFECSSENMNQKVVKKRAQVLVFDDFNKSPFDQNNTMAISLFNLMFDWSLSHISLDSLKECFDDSFFSRFDAIINLDEPVFYKMLKDLPPREGRNDEKYQQFLVKEGLMKIKPCFPLTISNMSSTSSDNLKNSVFGDDIPIVSESYARCKTFINDRTKNMLKNPISTKWIDFPEVTLPQASYIFYTSLFILFDVLWCNMTFNEREAIFPLQTGRALKSNTPPKFYHSQLNPKVFNPSFIISNFTNEQEDPSHCVELASELCSKKGVKMFL